MKTLRLALLALLVAGTANAQFFQRVYGTPNSRDVLESGTNYDYPGIPATQQGQVMAGFTDYNSTGIISPMVTRTAMNGAPIFNNTYPLNLYGRFVEAAARRVITYTGGRIGVIGDFAYIPNTPHTGVFYMVLNPNGTVGFVKTYNFQSLQSVEATSITPSASTAPQNAYVCGNITNAAGGRHPFVLSIQAFSGLLNWGHEYNDVGAGATDWTVEDLIESPYPNSVSGALDVALVGRYVLNPGGVGHGNLFTVDALSGAVSSFVHEYGSPNEDAGFNAIIVANNGFNGGPGYAIAGFTYNAGSTIPTYDMWAMKLAPNGLVQFSSRMDYSLTGRNDYGYDIIERFSPTLLAYEYYVGGYVDQGIFGQEDEVVYKLDFGGNPFPGPGFNQFTYGGPGFERILQMDYYQNGVPANNVGLSMFNWTLNSFPVLGVQDFYHVKSYFNGVTPVGGLGCNSNQQTQLWQPGPPLLDSTKGDTINIIKTDTLMAQLVGMQNAVLCSQNAVGGGSNTRLANSGEFSVAGSSLFPNPVTVANPVVNLTFDVPGVNDVVEIELWNTLGQLILHKQETLADGQTLLQINLGEGLSSGVYNLTIRRGGELFNHKISVQ